MSGRKISSRSPGSSRSSEASGSHDCLPCVCEPHQGCCREHRSTCSLNPWRPSTSKNTSPTRRGKHRLMSKFLSPPNPTDDESKPLLERSETKELPQDLQTTYTLIPIHPAVNCHIAFENLACVSRRLNPAAKPALMRELWCKGSTSSGGVQYYWYNEIYYQRGTFLQKQDIQCWLYNSFNCRAEQRFTGCPHQSLSVSSPRFRHREGLFEAEATITNHPPRCKSHQKGQRWSSRQGRYAQMIICTICHSDAECVIELKGHYLSVLYTCYRDLGAGTDPGHHKWLSLLTGEGSPNRPEYELDLYARVWRLAYRLGGRGLEKVIHQTPQGLFDVSSRNE